MVEAPHEYYSGRLEATQRRKATLTEQLLVDSDITQVRRRARRNARLKGLTVRSQGTPLLCPEPCVCACACVWPVQSRKKRYAKLQEEATRHQKVKKRKTELPRLDKPKHRPKH